MTFEKRVAMPDRKSLVSTLWLSSSLALLAWMPVAQIRTSGLVTVASRPDCLCRNLALLPEQPTSQLGAEITADAVLQVNAVPSEDEEQDLDVALDEPRVSFLIPCSFRKLPDLRLSAPRSILSFYPLRC